VSRVPTCLCSLLFIFIGTLAYPSPDTDVPLLPAVRVSGDRQGLRAASSSDWDVLSGDALQATGARTLDEALASGVAGVRVERSGGRERGAGIRIRGMGGTRVLFLIDGKALGSAPGAEIPDIALADIARVEILRGAASARYGDRAMGGVINIVTKKDDPDDLIVNLGCASFATLNAALFAPLSFGRTHLALSASGEKSGGAWLFPAQVREYPDGLTALDGEKVRALNTEYAAYRGRLHLANESAAGTRFTLDGEYAARDAGAAGTIDFPTTNASMHDQRVWVSAGLRALPSLVPLGGRLDVSCTYFWQKRAYRDFSLYDTESRYALTHGALAGVYTLPLSLSASAAPNEDESGYGSENSGVDVANGDTNFALLRFGLEAEYLSLAAEGIWRSDSFGDPKRFALAMYADGELGVSAFTFSLALRGDYHEGYAVFFSPSLGCAWSPHPDWRVAVNAGAAYRVPSFEELFWPAGAFAVGNALLRPESALSGDSSLTWQIGASAQARLAAFVQAYDDLILWQPSAGGVWRPTNIARVFTRGIEATFSGESALSALWVFAYSAEYSLQLSEDTSPGAVRGRLLPRVPQDKGSVRAGLRIPSRAALHIAASYTGFRYLNRANTKYLGGYFLLDSALELYPASWAKIKFAVHNIFDTAYVHLREYPVPGREWLVSLEIRL